MREAEGACAGVKGKGQSICLIVNTGAVDDCQSWPRRRWV